MSSSNEQLIEFLSGCEQAIVHTWMLFLKSRLSRKSLKLCKKYDSPENIPEQNTPERKELARELVNLLSWYGSNSLAYGGRKLTKPAASKQYNAIAMDVAKIIRRRLPRKQRPDIPRAPGVSELEAIIAEMLIAIVFHNKSTDEIHQILEEAGLEKDVAAEAARKFGPGISAITLPILTKILGKKTVTVIIEQVIISITSKRLGKEAAKAFAKRMLIKFPQKAITRFINIIGWILLAIDALLFVTSPARRMTVKAVPFIALSRVRNLVK